MPHELNTGTVTKVGADRTGLVHQIHRAALGSHWICYDQTGVWAILCEHRGCQHTRSNLSGCKAHKSATITINLLKFLAFLL